MPQNNLSTSPRLTAFVCVSDIANGFTELNNTPHTRRVKTVFLAKRHKIDDMAARTRCMETLRELLPVHVAADPGENQAGAALHLPRPEDIVQRD